MYSKRRRCSSDNQRLGMLQFLMQSSPEKEINQTEVRNIQSVARYFASMNFDRGNRWTTNCYF